MLGCSSHSDSCFPAAPPQAALGEAEEQEGVSFEGLCIRLLHPQAGEDPAAPGSSGSSA